MPGDITILHKRTKINDHIPEIRCVMDVIFIFHFGLCFAFLGGGGGGGGGPFYPPAHPPPQQPKQLKF